MNMNLNCLACSAVLLFGVAQAAAAQVPTGTSGTTAANQGVFATTTIDVSRLPIDLQRIQSRFRQGQIREERSGLNLRYFVDVFAKAPELKLFTKEDNLEYGRAPYRWADSYRHDGSDDAPGISQSRRCEPAPSEHLQEVACAYSSLPLRPSKSSRSSTACATYRTRVCARRRTASATMTSMC